MIEVRAEPADNLRLIADVDRSEHIDTIVEATAGGVTRRPVDIDVPGWTAEGDGPHSVTRIINELGPKLERGAKLLVAYDRETVAGVAVVEERFEGDMAWLTFLHVSYSYRGRGVGTALWLEAVDRARTAGASSIYVSATPSGSTIDFYLARGCVVLTDPHPELFAHEPEDIHLQATIS